MPGHSQRGDVPWLSIDGYSWYGTFHGGIIFNSFKISTCKNSNSLGHVFNLGWQGKRWLFSGSSLNTMQSKNKLELS